jgi:hypothetical protein
MDLVVVAVFFEEGPYSEFLAEYEYPIHDVRLAFAPPAPERCAHARASRSRPRTRTVRSAAST